MPFALGLDAAVRRTEESRTVSAWHGIARHGTARRGVAGQGTERRGMAWHGSARHTMASSERHGTAWHDMAWHGMAWHGTARHATAQYGMARYGMAGHVRAWQGTVAVANTSDASDLSAPCPEPTTAEELATPFCRPKSACRGLQSCSYNAANFRFKTVGTHGLPSVSKRVAPPMLNQR